MRAQILGWLAASLLAGFAQPALAVTVTAGQPVTFVWSPALVIPPNSLSYGTMNFANMNPAADPLATYCLGDGLCSDTPASIINGIVISNTTNSFFSFVSLTVSTRAGSFDMDPCFSIGSQTAPCVYSDQHEVPEPGTFALLGLGLVGLGLRRRMTS